MAFNSVIFSKTNKFFILIIFFISLFVLSNCSTSTDITQYQVTKTLQQYIIIFSFRHNYVYIELLQRNLMYKSITTLNEKNIHAITKQPITLYQLLNLIKKQKLHFTSVGSQSLGFYLTDSVNGEHKIFKIQLNPVIQNKNGALQENKIQKPENQNVENYQKILQQIQQFRQQVVHPSYLKSYLMLKNQLQIKYLIINTIQLFIILGFYCFVFLKETNFQFSPFHYLLLLILTLGLIQGNLLFLFSFILSMIFKNRIHEGLILCIGFVLKNSINRFIQQYSFQIMNQYPSFIIIFIMIINIILISTSEQSHIMEMFQGVKEYFNMNILCLFIYLLATLIIQIIFPQAIQGAVMIVCQILILFLSIIFYFTAKSQEEKRIQIREIRLPIQIKKKSR